MIKLDLLKDGKKNALTLSYDDGTVFDRKLIEILNRYGIRGSFHLVSSWLNDGKHINSSEIKELYKNHEVSCHGLYHTSMDLLRDFIFMIARQWEQVRKDKEAEKQIKESLSKITSTI